MPIPFSNLGMIIPEVFLPWQTQHESEHDHLLSDEGYKGRVRTDFLAELQINAEQMQQYLKTYIKHSDDFPSNVYISLQQKFVRAQRMHTEVKALVDPSQVELTATASGYIDYMREVKTMCHNVWAKFDDFYINQGVLLFTLTVIMTLLTLFDINSSIASLGRNLKIACILGVPISLLTLVISPLPLDIGVGSIMDVILSLSFYPLILFIVIHSLLIIYNIYRFLRGAVVHKLLLFLDQLTFTYIFSTAVAIGCSLSLVSNSFILYEGDMTVFLIQSMLICFLLQKAQSLAEQTTPSSLNNENDSKLKSNFSLSSLLEVSWPLLLVMVLVRLSKVFHACRDLQVGCESTSFIQPWLRAMETLGLFVSVRLVFSCVGVICVPLALAGFVRINRDYFQLNRWMLWCIYGCLPLSSLCVCGFWLIQALPQPILDSLPHWQHVVLPRSVYAISISTILVCILTPFRKKTQQSLSHNINGEKEQYIHPHNQLGRRKLNSDNLRRRVLIHKATAYYVDLKKTQADINSCMVYFTLLVALWLPIALLLNDGVALSATVLAVQLVLIITSLHQSQGIIHVHTSNTNSVHTMIYSLYTCVKS